MSVARKTTATTLSLALFSTGALLGAPVVTAQSSLGSLGSLSGNPPPPGGDNGNPGPVVPEPEEPAPESKLDRTIRTIIGVKKLRDHYGYSALRQQRRIEVQETSEAAQKYAEDNLAYFTEISNTTSEVAPYEWPYVGLLERAFVAEVEAEPGSDGYVGLPAAVDEDGDHYSGSRVYRYYYAGAEDLQYQAFTWWWNLQTSIDHTGYVNEVGDFVRQGSAEHGSNLPTIHVDNPPAALTRDEQLAAPRFFPSVGYGAVHDSRYIYIVEFGENPDYLPR